MHTLLISMDRSSEQKINKPTEILIDSIERLDLIFSGHYIQCNGCNYKSFSSTHRMVSGIDHILGHKTKLNKFNSIEIISSISSDHNGIKLKSKHIKRNKKKKLHGD